MRPAPLTMYVILPTRPSRVRDSPDFSRSNQPNSETSSVRRTWDQRPPVGPYDAFSASSRCARRTEASLLMPFSSMLTP